MIPNTFFTIAIPPSPNKCSILLVKRKTMYMIMTLIKIPIMIFTSENSAFNDTIDVIVPAPAMIGKAKGITLATFQKPHL